MPFQYPAELQKDLLPFLDARMSSRSDRGWSFLSASPAAARPSTSSSAELGRQPRPALRRARSDLTPEETLNGGAAATGQLMAALRQGLAARFAWVPVQPADEGRSRRTEGPGATSRTCTPDRGVPARRRLTGLTRRAASAARGTSAAGTARPRSRCRWKARGCSRGAGHLEMKVARPARATPHRSFTEETGRASPPATAPTRPGEPGLVLTLGGEPTFTSREHPAAPEWNGEALGPTKLPQGARLVNELRRRLCPGAALMHRQGKLYPGEPLPRWALDLVARRDGLPVWSSAAPVSAAAPLDERAPTLEDARRLADELERRLGLSGSVIPAFEDPGTTCARRPRSRWTWIPSRRPRRSGRTAAPRASSRTA
jgi:hypothetical protein